MRGTSPSTTDGLENDSDGADSLAYGPSVEDEALAFLADQELRDWLEKVLRPAEIVTLQRILNSEAVSGDAEEKARWRLRRKLARLLAERAADVRSM
jgi:hypothetical protein